MRFQVFRNGKTAERFKLCGAYLFGTDGTSIRRAQITFSDGYVECQKPGHETAGLALLWPVEGFGRILLPTTCLPERTRPYCLNVEIARARLMQIVSCREDWSLFEGMAELEDISIQARQLFIQSVQNINDRQTAAKLADNSLRKAMIFSEKLATTHADSMFKARKSTRGFGPTCLGMHVDMAMINNPLYLDRLVGISDFAMIPIRWADIEQREGEFDFSLLDQGVDALKAKKMRLTAGPLLHFSQQTLPDWLLDRRPSFEEIRDAAYQFATETVMRYRKTIHRWIVVSGLNEINQFGFSVEQILEMTRAATMAVKAVNPRSFRLIEVTDIWGEYHAVTANTISPLAYMDMILQSGISFDAFALQMRFGKNMFGMHVRDMMQITSILDYFALMGKPLYITSIEIPSESGTGDYDERVAGVWHKAWDAKRQGLWLDQFYRIILSKPLIEAAVYGNLADRKDSVIAHSGLVKETLEPKDGYLVMKRFRELIRSKDAGSGKGDAHDPGTGP